MLVYYAKNKVNGKGYVGKTKRPFEVRWKEHLEAAEKGVDQIFYHAIRKHGIEAFECSVLEECVSEVELNLAETKWIHELKTYVSEWGYNMTLGGDGVIGLKHSAKTRAQMSLSRTGEKNHNYGKAWGKIEWSDEDRNNVTQKNRNNPACHKPRTEDSKVAIALDSSKRRKLKTPVVQLTLEGQVVAQYASIRKAADAVGGLGGAIKKCCVDERRSYKGYKWQYVSEPKPTWVARCSLDGEILQTYALAVDAVKELGCTMSGISKVLCGTRPTYFGYVWKYVSEHSHPVERTR